MSVPGGGEMNRREGGAAGSRPRVVVTAPMFARNAAALDALRAAGAEVLVREGAALGTALADADVAVIGGEPVDDAALAGAARLRVIAKYGAGTDGIDLQAATRRGVVVANTPGANAETVADTTLALLLALTRNVVAGHQAVRAGRFEPIVGMETCGKTLGVVGLGAIGSAVARRARGFDMRVLVCDTSPDPAFVAAHAIEVVPLERLLERSDFVTLHVPLRPSTRRLIDAAALRRMKPTALFINTSRGEVVDEQALYRALVEGWIAGAGLDVFAQEPPPPDHPLLHLPNVVATPHLGGKSRESMARVGDACVANVLAGLRGELPRYALNPDAMAARRNGADAGRGGAIAPDSSNSA